MSERPTVPSNIVKAVRRGRPPKYTSAQIVDAALLVARRTGLDALSMAEVASELGTTQATLYRYVDNRDHLLHSVVDKFLASATLPDPPRGGSSSQERAGWLVAMVLETRDHLLQVGGAADYLLLNGPTGEAGLGFMAMICQVLSLPGRPPAEIARAYDLLMTTAMAYTSKTERLAAVGGSVPRMDALADLQNAVGRDPLLGAVLSEFSGDMDRAFRSATQTIIDQIEPPAVS